jgi:hypothetical protein
VFLFTLIGLLCGVVAYLLQPRVYQSRMIANSSILQNPEVIAVVESWQEYLKNDELEALSKVLGLPVQTLRKVYLLEVRESKPNADGFSIYTKVGDNAVLKDLQKAIVTNFENNAFVRERIAIRRKNMQRLLKEIDSEIAKLERTRSIVENLLEAPTQRGASMMIDLGNTGNINYQIMGLHEKRFGIEEQLQLLDDFQLIEGFNVSETPSNPKLLKTLVIGAFLGFMTATGIIIFRLLKRKVQTHQQYAVLEDHPVRR